VFGWEGMFDLGVDLLLYQTDPIVFDKSTDLFIKGRKKADRSPDPD
jgi:hypothetical protein